MTTASIVDNFPALRQSIGDKSLVYLDSAATTQKPQSVIDAVTRYYEHDNANIHRGVHTLTHTGQDASGIRIVHGGILHTVLRKMATE